VSEEPRLRISIDRLAVLKIREYGNHKSVRSLWITLEDLAFKNAKKYPGKSFVIKQEKLAPMAGLSVPTLKRACKHLVGIGLLSVKHRKRPGCAKYDRNFYTLHYPKQPIDHSDLRNHRSCNNLDKQLGEASICPAPDGASPLPLRQIDASPQKRKTETVDAEAAAKQLAAAEERKRQEEAELAELKERERIEKEQRLERLRLAEEKQKADEDAARLAEDARRLAMRTDVGSCVAAIHRAAFDEYNAGTLYMLLADYDRSTFDEAVGKLLPDMSDKVRACIKNNEWMFE